MAATANSKANPTPAANVQSAQAEPEKFTIEDRAYHLHGETILVTDGLRAIVRMLFTSGDDPVIRRGLPGLLDALANQLDGAAQQFDRGALDAAKEAQA